MDGRLIFLHHVGRLIPPGHWPEGERPARRGRPARARAHTIPKSLDGQEKPMPDKSRVRTKTDTGRRDEDSKALERTLVKELCKLTP